MLRLRSYWANHFGAQGHVQGQIWLIL
jgi:hypothetical protein